MFLPHFGQYWALLTISALQSIQYLFSSIGASGGYVVGVGEAIKCYDSALDINPQYADVWPARKLARSNLA